MLRIIRNYREQNMIKKEWNKKTVESCWELCRKKTKKTWELHQKEIVKTAAGIFLACIVSVGAAAVVQPNAYEISYNGELLGYVQSEASVKAAVQSLQETVTAQTGLTSVMVDEEGLSSKRTKVKTKTTDFADADQLADMLLKQEAYSCEAYTILVDETPILASASEDEAKAILEQVKKSYGADGSKILSADYKENVEIVVSDAKNIPVAKDVQSGVSYILTGKEEPRPYTVQDGDTLWDIAHANAMSSAELIAANPGFDPNKLKIGQELNLVAMKPFVTVVVTQEVKETESIPFTTQYKKNSSMYKGQTSIITAGKNGSKEIVSKVVSENGVVVSREKISETVISEPVMQTAYQGTKSKSSSAVYVTASKKIGGLSNPLASIQISDGYGASRGNRRHKGVDLRAPKGTPIYAAANGVVTKVSSSGSYGKLVVIDHGNGLVTKYAHCNSFNVSVGDSVKRGQQIATVGRTGNATGNILHYEVLVNGANRNPASYLH